MNKILLITTPVNHSKEYICNLLQHAWDSIIAEDRRKNKNTKSLLSEDEDFKIIDSKQQYETSKNDKKFVPDVVFIVPELMWGNDAVNEGYDIARELITKTFKSKFTQIVFISILERVALKKLVNRRNKSLVGAFPHFCILESKTNIQFEYYSEIHYKLLQHIAISDHGRLEKIGHDLNAVSANIKTPSYNELAVMKNSLKNNLEELTLFQQWSEQNITEILQGIESLKNKKELDSIAKSVHGIIEEIRLKLPDSTKSQIPLSEKSSYRVFIIEDDIDFRSFFYDILSQFYTEVYPNRKNEVLIASEKIDFSINNVYKIINQIGANIDIFLLDLLYKDEKGNWLNFNGLDLFKLINKINPYAVIRIITSLPRSIVAKLVEVIMSSSEKPDTDQVFTKKYGFDALKDSICENIPKINEECKIKEKSKTVWIPFPKNGVFEWSGVNNYLHTLVYSNKDNYTELKTKVQCLFNLYAENNLYKTTTNWNNGVLPKPAQKDITDNAVYIKSKLINIMVHRLIAITEALKDEQHKVFYSDYLTKISPCTNIKSINKGYFQTKLGFNGKEYKNEADTSKHYFQINFINLFPHEYEYTTDYQREKNRIDESKKLSEDYPNLNVFFLNILTDTSIYDSWEDLELGYNPYLSNRIINKIESGTEILTTDFATEFTLKNVRDFFQSLINNYSDEYVSNIISRITDYVLDGDVKFEENLEDTLTNTLINILINKDLQVE